MGGGKERRADVNPRAALDAELAAGNGDGAVDAVAEEDRGDTAGDEDVARHAAVHAHHLHLLVQPCHVRRSETTPRLDSEHYNMGGGKGKHGRQVTVQGL